MAVAKLAIFSTDMLWIICCKFNLEQHSHSMSVANIAILAVKSQKTMKMIFLNRFSITMAKPAIFSTDMLWESCHEFNSE